MICKICKKEVESCGYFNGIKLCSFCYFCIKNNYLDNERFLNKLGSEKIKNKSKTRLIDFFINKYPDILIDKQILKKDIFDIRKNINLSIKKYCLKHKIELIKNENKNKK